VRETEKHERVIEEVNAAASRLGLQVLRVMESPVRGAQGNIEFLVLYEKVAP
jgi:23S rRNA (cytidine1920-2'-O)/16S rRNA (cytidine1409-2'-O)-methyltransferase